MRYNIIAIEREYASGGSEIGAKLALKLGIPCYGREILEQATEKLDVPPELLAEMEEKMTGSFLYGLLAFANLSSGQNNDALAIEQRLAFAEADVIKNLSISPCVLVGRGAAAILKDKEKALKVFIHADNKMRKDRAISIYGIDPKQADSVIQRFDKRRATYFKVAMNTDWKNADIYHLFLNSSKLSIDEVVDIIYATVKGHEYS